MVTDKKPSVVGVSQIEMIGKVKPNGYDAQSRPEVSSSAHTPNSIYI